MPDDTHGLMSTCSRPGCGGMLTPTGQTRVGPRQTAFGGAAYRVRSAEYRCGLCGAREWAETGHEDEPNGST